MYNHLRMMKTRRSSILYFLLTLKTRFMIFYKNLLIMYHLLKLFPFFRANKIICVGLFWYVKILKFFNLMNFLFENSKCLLNK